MEGRNPSGPFGVTSPFRGGFGGSVCGAWKGSPERGAVADRRLRGYSPPHLHVVYAMKADAIVRGADMDTRQSRLKQGFHLLGRLLLCESNLVYNPQKQGGVVNDGGALGKKLGTLFYDALSSCIVHHPSFISMALPGSAMLTTVCRRVGRRHGRRARQTA